MSVVSALSVAFGRTSRAWRAVGLVYLLNLVLAGVLASLVYAALASSLGTSLAGERMRAGFDPYWYNSYSSQATGVAAAFRPSVNGKGAVFDALDAFFDGFLALLFGPGFGAVPLVLAYLLAWSFVSGGFIARFNGPADPPAFVASAGRHFPGILTITLVGIVLFGAMLGPVRFWIDATLATALREEIDERVRFAWMLGEYLAIWMVIWTIRLVLDYAKVRVVLRAGVSSIAEVPRALWGATRLVVRHPLKTGGLHLCLGVIWLVTIVFYVAIVPGAGISTMTAVAATFLLGQLYILSRVFLRALFLAGATVMSTALAGVAAEPPPSAP